MKHFRFSIRATLAILLTFSLLLSSVGLTLAQPLASPVMQTESQEVAGRWEGSLTIMGMALDIVVNIEEKDGEFAGTVDIPQQGAMGLPIAEFSFDEGQIYFEMLSGPQLAVFDGALQEDGRIEGIFRQMGIEGEFTLERVDAPVEAEEPEALPYRAEEVTVESGEVTLAGTLTLPPGDGPHPAVVLISGSGPQNRDEEIPSLPGYRPFAWVADHLTREGIAVLRYDDRGVAESTGDHETATSADFADDAEAVLGYLQNHPEINPDQVGLFGHSEGGLIGAMVAARNPNAAFFIAMGATAQGGYDLLLQQNIDILRASGASDEEIDAQVAQVRSMLDLVRAQDWDALEEMTLNVAIEQLRAMPEEQQAAFGDLEAYAEEVTAQAMVNLQSWMYFFVTHDPADDWAQIEAPILVLLGGLDTQVSLEQARSSLEAAFAESGNPDATIEVFPEANHLFQKAETGGPDEYATLPNEFVPGFLETISDWLLARVETADEAMAAKLAPLDEVIEAEMEALGVPGATIAVVKDGRVVYEKGFGVASIETEVPVTPEMLFRIGSTTKMYTAVGLALLVEEGKVDLHAPIGDYIDGLDPDLARVTAHQLLVHMAGLKDEAPSFGRHDPEGMGAMIRGWTGSDYLFAEPGKVFSYANPGYAIAGLLLEEAGDQPYAEQMTERIFEPLGMERTTFRPTEAMTWPFSQGHQPQPNGTYGVVRPYPDNAPYWPAGFMITNVSDLARFAIAFMNGGEINGEQVLSASALEMLPTAHADMGDEQYYGYGLFMYDLRGVQVVEHGGGIAGFSSIFKMAPDHQFAVIILTNLEGAFLDQAAEEAMALLLPLEPKEEDVDEEVTLSEEELARYTGTYRQIDEPGMVVVIEDGQLVVQAMGLELPLKPIGDHRFLIELPAMPEPLPVWFTTGDDDEIEYFSAGSRAYRRE